MRAIAIDFETANEARTSPCSVGLAWIEDGVVTRREYRLIRPPTLRFAPGNVRVHGLRPADVADAPELPEAIGPFLAEMAETPLLAHNAGFDIAVLCGTLALYRAPVPRLAYLCTKALGRRAWPEGPRFGLAALAGRIGHGFNHHHALDDAEACARIALAAAHTVGTNRIGIAAGRLGVHHGSVDWPVHVPCRSAALDRSRSRERRPAPRPATPLAFTMRGSSGRLYAVDGQLSGETLSLRCSCTAGQFRRRCRHVSALLDGEIADLVSENYADLERLRGIVLALGEDAVRPRAAALLSRAA